MPLYVFFLYSRLNTYIVKTNSNNEGEKWKSDKQTCAKVHTRLCSQGDNNGKCKKEKNAKIAKQEVAANIFEKEAGGEAATASEATTTGEEAAEGEDATAGKAATEGEATKSGEAATEDEDH